MRIPWYVNDLTKGKLDKKLIVGAHQGLPRTGSIPRMQRGLPERRKIKDVKKVIAVSSAKGGVGKSTLSGMEIK